LKTWFQNNGCHLIDTIFPVSIANGIDELSLPNRSFHHTRDPKIPVIALSLCACRATPICNMLKSKVLYGLSGREKMLRPLETRWGSIFDFFLSTCGTIFPVTRQKDFKRVNLA